VFWEPTKLTRVFIWAPGLNLVLRRIEGGPAVFRDETGVHVGADGRPSTASITAHGGLAVLKDAVIVGDLQVGKHAMRAYAT
jgi:hypothetical protein